MLLHLNCPGKCIGVETIDERHHLLLREWDTSQVTYCIFTVADFYYDKNSNIVRSLKYAFDKKHGVKVIENKDAILGRGLK